jgi:hypothetical protein
MMRLDRGPCGSGPWPSNVRLVRGAVGRLALGNRSRDGQPIPINLQPYTPRLCQSCMALPPSPKGGLPGGRANLFAMDRSRLF